MGVFAWGIKEPIDKPQDNKEDSEVKNEKEVIFDPEVENEVDIPNEGSLNKNGSVLDKNNKVSDDEMFNVSESLIKRDQNEEDSIKERKNTWKIINHEGKRLLHCLRYCWWASLNLFLVYWFEYVISTCFAEKLFVNDPDNPTPYWALANNYEILQFCYQFGVTISRSSVKILRIKYVWIMTLLQLLFLIFWFTLAEWKYMSTPFWIWFTFPIMIIVGLMGGASYVNCYYLILNHEKLNEKDREYAANITAITNTLGITTSSVTTILFDLTILRTISTN